MDIPTNEIETLKAWCSEVNNGPVGSFPQCTYKALQYIDRLEADNATLRAQLAQTRAELQTATTAALEQADCASEAETELLMAEAAHAALLVASADTMVRLELLREKVRSYHTKANWDIQDNIKDGELDAGARLDCIKRAVDALHDMFREAGVE